MYRLVITQIGHSATTSVHNNGHALLLEYDVIYFHDADLCHSDVQHYSKPTRMYSCKVRLHLFRAVLAMSRPSVRLSGRSSLCASVKRMNCERRKET